MSTWIKVEKSLETDPRVLRMARKLGGVSSGNAPALRDVTLVVGCLTRLWIYADSHARADDTLDLGAADIDALLGVLGFCALMPLEWLLVLDEERVKLPEFQAHNGVKAIRKALTANRVAEHREREKLKSVTPCNADALPDRDQTETETETSKNCTSASPTAVVPRGTSDDGNRDADAVRRIFRHWQEIHGYRRAHFDAKRRKLICAALTGYSEADLCQAITGYSHSPHHMGQNDRDTKYNDLELILRDAKHIDAGIAFYIAPPRTHLSAKTRDAIDQVADWIPPELRGTA